MGRLLKVLVAAAIAGSTAACASQAASPYFPLTHDPAAVEPVWHRFALAFALNKKCNFLGDPAQLNLALVTAQQRARAGNDPTANRPDPDVAAITNTPPETLCNAAMRKFVEAQASAAKPD